MNFKSLFKKYNGYGMESSCYETPEFKTFASAFKRGLNAEAKARGMKVISFTKGHFYVSAFVERADGRMLYLSVGDMRNPKALANMYFRFVVNEKDYSGKGGRNINVSLDKLMDAIASEPFERSAIKSAYMAA